MLELLDIGVNKAVAFRCGGKITEKEMSLVLSTVKKKIETHDEAYLYEEIISVGGAEFDAIVDKIKFLHEIGISKITKIAVITDIKWMQKIITLKNKVFKNIEMKSFTYEDREKAVHFLKHVAL